MVAKQNRHQRRLETEESSPKDAHVAGQVRTGETGQAWGVEDSREHVLSADAVALRTEPVLLCRKMGSRELEKLDIWNFMCNFPNLETPSRLNKTRP